MKNNLLSISEFANMCNITAETLRHYDRKGLLTPDYVDPKTKYRYYNYSKYRCVKVITNLRSQGFLISEINNIFSADKQELLLAYYNKAITDIDRQIEELVSVKKSMENIVDFLDGKYPKDIGWKLKGIASRPLFSIKSDVIYSEADYYTAISNMEVYLNKKGINKNLIFSNNYLACLFNTQTNEFYNLSILDEDKKSSFLPKSLYLCKKIKGRLFSTLRHTPEISNILNEQKLKQNGPALVVALGESVILSPCLNMMYEIQVPVKRIYAFKHTKIINLE